MSSQMPIAQLFCVNLFLRLNIQSRMLRMSDQICMVYFFFNFVLTNVQFVSFIEQFGFSPYNNEKDDVKMIDIIIMSSSFVIEKKIGRAE